MAFSTNHNGVIVSIPEAVTWTDEIHYIHPTTMETIVFHGDRVWRGTHTAPLPDGAVLGRIVKK